MEQWDIETLRAYILKIIELNDKKCEEHFEMNKSAIQATVQAQKNAVEKSETAIDKRFESVNAFRGQLKDQAALFVNRTEYISSRDQMTELIVVIREQLATFVTRNEFNGAKDQASVSIRNNNERTALLVTREELNVLRLNIEKNIETLNKEIASLREAQRESSGKAAGASQLWGYLVAIAGITIAVVFHFLK